MGFRDDVRSKVEAQQQGAQKAADAAAVGGCTGDHYVTEVNRGSINMRVWQAQLNERYRAGYRLSHTFEQGGNTVQVFEHHWH